MKLFLNLERPGAVGNAEESPKSGRTPATAMRTVQLTLAALAACAASSAPDCAASDAALKLGRQIVCKSYVSSYTPWCKDDWQNVSAAGDWPAQAVYMRNVLVTLAAPSTCLDTAYAKDTAAWLNAPSTDDHSGAKPGNLFLWTWLVFQADYYAMPRKPGDRVESPDTLGRKCWAMAYLTDQWAKLSPALLPRLDSAGLDVGVFKASYEEAMPLTMGLCQKVICNCFVNASYDPSRSGHCRVGVKRFHYLGFDRENLKPQQGRTKVDYAWHEHCSR